MANLASMTETLVQSKGKDYQRAFLDKTYIDTNVFDKAYERVNTAFDEFDHVAVSFSGGKDSTVVLNIAYEVARARNRLPLHVICIDEEILPSALVEYLTRVYERDHIKMDWWCIPIKHRNATSFQQPFWYTWAPEDEDIWCRPLPKYAKVHLPGYSEIATSSLTARVGIPALTGLFTPYKDYGRTIQLLGIRADESMTRFRAVARKSVNNWMIAVSGGTENGIKFGDTKHVYKGYPIYDFGVGDIWKSMGDNQWDYCGVYDQYMMLGENPSRQRVAPPFGEEPMTSLYKWAPIDPLLWDKMAYRVRGAQTGARYATTLLYLHNRKTWTKPVNMTWEDFMLEIISKYPAKERKYVANNIKGFVKEHYRKTADPLIAGANHPVSNMSWDRLLKIALRGDFKGRQAATGNYSQGWDVYNKARAIFEANNGNVSIDIEEEEEPDDTKF